MERTVLAENEHGETALRAVRGDLTEERVDVIVNAANTRLHHGGGLAGAIVRRGGRDIQTESDGLAPVEVGAAVATGAGKLAARWVIHAVGPRWGEGDEERKLRSAVRSALERARELGARSVGLPAISTGIFGYPKDEGVEVIVDEVRRWVDDHPGVLSEVHCTAFDEPTAALFARVIGGSA